MKSQKKKDARKLQVGSISQDLSADKIDARIKELKDEMKRLAKELQFEEAAKLRDEIKQLTELRFII